MQLNRLTQQLQFIIEIDKLKNVLRQTLLIDASRRENSGEHSWHLAMKPFLHNQQTEGGSWKIHNISRSQVMQRMAPVEVGTPELWDFILAEIDNCITKRYLKSS